MRGEQKIEQRGGRGNHASIINNTYTVAPAELAQVRSLLDEAQGLAQEIPDNVEMKQRLSQAISTAGGPRPAVETLRSMIGTALLAATKSAGAAAGPKLLELLGRASSTLSDL